MGWGVELYSTVQYNTCDFYILYIMYKKGTMSFILIHIYYKMYIL
jgi:hypothetical protein